MSTQELIFTLLIALVALVYIYKSFSKKNSCGGSCGCSTPKKNPQKHAYQDEEKGNL